MLQEYQAKENKKRTNSSWFWQFSLIHLLSFWQIGVAYGPTLSVLLPHPHLPKPHVRSLAEGRNWIETDPCKKKPKQYNEFNKTTNHWQIFLQSMSLVNPYRGISGLLKVWKSLAAAITAVPWVSKMTEWTVRIANAVDLRISLDLIGPSAVWKNHPCGL